MRYPSQRWTTSIVALLTVLLMLGTLVVEVSPADAHEPTQTHRRMTVAAFSLYVHANDPPSRINGLPLLQIEREIAQGAMDEDRCIDVDQNGMVWGNVPLFWNHWYDPGARSGFTGDGVDTFFVPDCAVLGPFFEPMSAVDRAQMLWEAAEEAYAAGNRRGAFRTLGRVVHLLEDMTSPAHIHDDPHIGTDLDCSLDADDFERWGFCEGDPENLDTNHILDYFRYDGEGENPLVPAGDINSRVTDSQALTPLGCEPADSLQCLDYSEAYWGDKDSGWVGGYREAKAQAVCDGELPPAGFTCRLWEASKRIYGGEPQHAVVPQDKPAFSYAVRVSQLAYDFTTFRIRLEENLPGIPGDGVECDLPFPQVSASCQPDSEFNRMLRPNTNPALPPQDDCALERDEIGGFCYETGDWEVFGDNQQIGKSEGKCGRFLDLDTISEKWWVMKHRCAAESNLPGAEAVSGYAYIEDAGGSGSQFGDLDGPADRFVPLVYGCAQGTSLCGRAGEFRWGDNQSAKDMFKKLYYTQPDGSVSDKVSNQEDVLPCRGALDSTPCPTPRRGKTMLQIWGDALYTTAIAYGAGLIETFIESVAIRCDGTIATHVGTPKGELIRGSNGPDVIVGFGGDDIINGLGGADLICAGRGDDTISGGFGRDTIIGGDGNDEIMGGGANDRLFGGNGHDTISGGEGNDSMFGGPGRDVIGGGTGNDTIDGGPKGDTINGNQGQDTLQGARGNDALNGGTNADSLFGGPGDDTLNGGKGVDACTGGPGNDTLILCEPPNTPASHDPQ